MATFEEIARDARIVEVAELAEALANFEYNTARMFAVFGINEVAGHPLEQYRQQIIERTQFVLEDLRRPR